MYVLAVVAEIYEYRPTMYHCKVMIVDALLVAVGSTNFDKRSFRLNDEANLNIFDADFAREQTAIFRDDIARSLDAGVARAVAAAAMDREASGARRRPSRRAALKEAVTATARQR